MIDQEGGIGLAVGSLIREYGGSDHRIETERCRDGFNRDYAGLLAGQAVQISAWDADGDPRAVELRNHRFFIGTAFQPERSALRGENHPLITAFVKAASEK